MLGPELIVKAMAEIEPPTTTKQQVRSSKGHFYQPQHVKEACNRIYTNFAQYKLSELLEGPLKIVIRYTWAYPKSWPKKKKNLPFVYRDTKPDFDNAAKLFCDSLRGLFWVDDKQIAIGTMEEYYAAEPSIEMELYKLFNPEK